MKTQKQFLEIELDVPVGYQATGYDHIEPMGLFLWGGKACRNFGRSTTKEKFIKLELIEQRVTERKIDYCHD